MNPSPSSRSPSGVVVLLPMRPWIPPDYLLSRNLQRPRMSRIARISLLMRKKLLLRRSKRK
jgi:hypothetical protein